MWKATVIGLCLLFIPTQAIVSDAVFDNCVFLGGNRIKASWTVRRADSAIDFQLCGCDVDNPNEAVDSPNEYMGFGLSGSNAQILMMGADVTIAWVDNTLGAQAEDYYLSGYIQCRTGVGACPDSMDSSNGCTNDIYNVSGFKREGLQCVSFSRTFMTSDTICDIPFDVDTDQYIVWAAGGLGETAFKHFKRAEVGDGPIRLGREPNDECFGGLLCPNCPPFTETTMDVRGRNETFVANIGPPGNERGYMAITNQAGWGIAWYINDTLIPNIIVERGYTYTFISNGGSDAENAGNYHPFYITNSNRGGYLRNSETQRNNEVIYAGFDGETPIGIGPLCKFDEPQRATSILNTCGPQEDYIQSLSKPSCSSNSEGFTWTPDETTPDVVYYQCATHLNLGYKITVMGHAPKLVMYSATMMIMLALSFL